MNVVSDIRSKNMMTFPVLTYSLLRQNGKFVDEETARWCCKHNMKWADSNFFISDDITSLSNCCFDGEQEVIIYIDNTKKNIKLKDLNPNKTYTIYSAGEWAKGKAIKLPAKKMYEIKVENKPSMYVTFDHMFPVYGNGNKQAKDITKNDYLILDNTIEKDDYVRVEYSVPSNKNIEWVYCFEMENKDKPYFTLSNGIITHNCRLVSDVKNLGYFNSIGGTALEVGSIKVNTINLARIAYESKTEDEYIEILKEKALLCAKTLDVIRDIIQRNVEKGLLTNYSKKVINMKSQYSSFGILGGYEALQKFGHIKKDEFGNCFYTDEGVEFLKRILKTITEVKDEFTKDKNYSINIEQVPAERAAAVLMEKDKEIFPNEIYELPLYGNQWIPLGVKTTINEKIRLSAILDKACSGGSISHINLDAPFNNFETAWNLLNYIADAGVVYFAFNLKINSCIHNHGFYGDKCPICGEPVHTTYQRIVGFLTPTTTYSKERKAEFEKRTWFDLNNMSEM